MIERGNYSAKRDYLECVIVVIVVLVVVVLERLDISVRTRE